MSDVQTITQLTRSIKNHLNHDFGSVWVAGEVSGVTQPASGHLYFTLKDAGASINAIIWRSEAERLQVPLEDGLQVICRGGVDVYPQRGTYQLIVKQLKLDGVGQLQQAFRKLHAQLAAKGWFEDQHKRPIPRFPKHIAVVTSPTGAAVRDFLQVLLRRWPRARVTVIPAVVQGPQAAPTIARGIRLCHQLPEPPDVIVATRGGGSLEDLWAFNEPLVIQSIFEATIPVVSAVGHEIDVTLSDLVADLRALTPSEAAERLVPDHEQLSEQLQVIRERLHAAAQHSLVRAATRLQQWETRPALARPLDRLRQSAQELDFLDQRLQRTAKQELLRRQSELAACLHRLEAINPLSVLARGYSLTTRQDGQPIGSLKELQPGDPLLTRMEQGTITSRVEHLEPNDQQPP